MDFQVSEGHLISIIPFVGSVYALSPVPPRVDGDEPPMHKYPIQIARNDDTSLYISRYRRNVAERD
jgi:hypothetical protein